MSDLRCVVSKVLEVTDIPGADRIQMYKVLGWNCVAGKGQYSVNDLVLFIPPDAILPNNMVEQFKLTFLGKGGRVKAIKLLKGTIVSQGLILDNYGKWEEGTEVSKELGITKWEPPEPSYGVRPVRLSVSDLWIKYRTEEITLNRFTFELLLGIKDHITRSKRKRRNPNFVEYTDIQNINHYPDILNGDMVVITEKLHGANIRFCYIERLPTNIVDLVINKIKGKYYFTYGSRRVEIQGTNKKTYYGENVYGEICNKYNIASKLSKYPNLIFYGELIGPKIQDLTYGLKERELRIFDIKSIKDNRYLDWDNVLAICNKLNLPTVNELWRGAYTVDIVKQYSSGNSTIDPTQIREGVVVKCIEEGYSNILGRKILKCISSEYLTRKGNTTEYH